MATAVFPVRGRHEGNRYSLEEVISVLTAQRLLINEAVGLLEQLDPDFDAQRVVIRVVSIEEGSLAWDLAVEIWGVYQKQITEKVVKGVEGALDVDVPKELEPLLTLALLAVTYWGLRYAYDRVARRKAKDKEPAPAPPVHIEGNYNTVINVIANETNTTAGSVERALHATLEKDHQKVAKAAVDFVNPARRRNDAGVTFDGMSVDIGPDALAEVPSDAELARTSESKRIPLDGVELSIRGTDRDSHTQGWRGLIDGDDRFPKRLPIVLDPTIDRESLADFHRVNADIIVEGEQFMDGSFVPRRIHLRRFDGLD